jgi:uncharacterized protein YqjF (DUF2071 family)
MKTPGKFLTAEWRHLAMLNYEMEPALVRPHVPRGTELDVWNGKILVSVVGFLFLNTRVLGLPMPFHRNFEELNLRCYVRRRGPEGWRRGVVFIKEIVPRRAIAALARWLYNEQYVALPMRHTLSSSTSESSSRVEYAWRHRGRWNRLAAQTTGELHMITPGSEEEFITEHYWGYTAQRDGACLEYQVEHPPWRVRQVRESVLDCDAAELYGPEFGAVLSGQPSSAFVAEGSAVIVRRGVRI